MVYSPRLLRRRAWSALCFIVGTVVCIATPGVCGKKPQPLVERWTAGSPCCTFARSNDGKYRYRVATPDYEVTLAVDSQELTLMRRRVEPFFSVLIDVHYHGATALPVNPSAASLEFVKHHKVVQTALDPDSFALRTQDDADQLEFETEREIKKHPDKKDEREHYVQAYQKEVATFLEFLSRSCLPAVQLDSANQQVSGWLLFSTRSKWLGSWKTPEQFLLRLPMGDRVLEFPFSLPPEQGDLILRKRAD